MRLPALITIALLSLPAHAAQVTTFNKECVENESVITAIQAPQAMVEGEACDRGQLTAEDLSYVEAVQPANTARKIRNGK